jgi:hypothetical protein
MIAAFVLLVGATVGAVALHVPRRWSPGARAPSDLQRLPMTP